MTQILKLSAVAAFVALTVACGGADANQANRDMSGPSHDNMSPTVGDGGAVDSANTDLSKPAKVNESPAPGGSH